MTMNIDQELSKWLDTSGSLDDQDIKLKEGAPEEVKKKFEEFKKRRDEYEALWSRS